MGIMHGILMFLALSGLVIGELEKRQTTAEEKDLAKIATMFGNTRHPSIVAMYWESSVCNYEETGKLNYLGYYSRTPYGCFSCRYENELQEMDSRISGTACPPETPYCYSIYSGTFEGNDYEFPDLQTCTAVRYKPEQQIDFLYYENYCDPWDEPMSPVLTAVTNPDGSQECTCLSRKEAAQREASGTAQVCAPLPRPPAKEIRRTCGLNRARKTAKCGPISCPTGTTWKYTPVGFICQEDAPTPSSHLRQRSDEPRERFWEH